MFFHFSKTNESQQCVFSSFKNKMGLKSVPFLIFQEQNNAQKRVFSFYKNKTNLKMCFFIFQKQHQRLNVCGDAAHMSIIEMFFYYLISIMHI